MTVGSIRKDGGLTFVNGGLAFVYGGQANGNIALSRTVARLVLGKEYLLETTVVKQLKFTKLLGITEEKHMRH